MTTALTRPPADPHAGGVAAVERLLRVRGVSCKGRLIDLACDILRAAGTRDPDAPPTATPRIDVDCYHLALQRLVDACAAARLPGYIHDALIDAAELLEAVTAEGTGAVSARPPSTGASAGSETIGAVGDVRSTARCTRVVERTP